MDLNNLLAGVTIAGVMVPGWALIAGGVVVLFLLFSMMRPRRAAAVTNTSPQSGIGTLVLLALVAVVAGGAYFGLKQFEDHSRFVERKALEDRAAGLLSQANQSGSVLGCLNGAVTAILDEACEKQIFAEPGRLAAAVGMTAERIALLADATNFSQREPAFLDRFEHLRKSIEADPFGLVAHVFATENKCIPDSCTRFRFLKETDKVKANLSARKFEGLLAKYSPAWAQDRPPANTSAAPTTPTSESKDQPPANQTATTPPPPPTITQQPSSTPVAIPQQQPAPPSAATKQKANPKQTPQQQANPKQAPNPAQQAKRKGGPPEPVGGLPRVTARGNQNAAPADDDDDDAPAVTPAPQQQTPSIFNRR